MKTLMNSGLGGYTSTASFTVPQPRLVTFPFGAYEVVVAVTEDNKMIGVAEVRVKKDFLTIEQKLDSSSYIDVDEFYRE